MSTFIIEIHPKKSSFDPLAKQVRAELIEAGESPKLAEVSTQRLFKIEGNFSLDQIESISEALLVDPIVETAKVEGLSTKKSKKKSKSAGWVLDIWPKPGVTDPVGETIQKGLNDLGYTGETRASSATRYVFPKLKEASVIKNLAKQILANELIHDIHIRELN